MDRRSFIKKAGVGSTAAVAASTLAAPAIAQGREKLVMVTAWGRGLAGVFDAAQRVADSVNAMSGGTLEIEIKAQGELVSGLPGLFDAVTSGQADMYHAADYYYVGQHPAFGFFTAVPFGMTPNELHNWYYHGGGHGMHRELGEEFGLVSFLAGNTGPQAGGWFRKEINSADDFKGLKFRMPGLGGKALGKLGASVQTIAGSEVYQALASGALDGTEWIGPWADEKAGFQEITKIYYTSGFHEPGAGLALATNADRWASLSDQHKKIIEIAAGEANLWNLHQYLANNSEALARLQAGGVKTLEFPDAVWDAFGAASKEVMEENFGDPLFKKVFDSVNDSMKKSASWDSLSSVAYTRQRTRVLG
ncbi:TRAP transporter substrate-binding protein [Pelagibius sp. Alg239-R121]|uniref:TRAP transporter substrate-binding protein n=1 Tax=Pelagibius sp. Alg239-R121 TaxID=2993448 RepID=UPI0024A6EEBB|nr:TRAP transporter substrate-binding protein [Pelagibius sp. Alg239-R121]